MLWQNIGTTKKLLASSEETALTQSIAKSVRLSQEFHDKTQYILYKRVRLRTVGSYLSIPHWEYCSEFFSGGPLGLLEQSRMRRAQSMSQAALGLWDWCCNAKKDNARSSSELKKEVD